MAQERKQDPIFVDALDSFRSDEAKNLQHDASSFVQWNSTSISLTTACLNHLIDTEPNSAVRRYTENLLQQFIKWYDSFWFFQNKPKYLSFPDYDPIRNARLVLEKADRIKPVA